MKVQGHFADFIEEERAVIRLFNQASMAATGPGESAGLMAKEFRFHEVSRERRAVELNQRVRSSTSAMMKNARD